MSPLLNDLFQRRTAAQLARDPLRFCHRFGDPGDREVAALLAAVYAYGNAAAICGHLERVFRVMGGAPRRFVEAFDPASGMEQFRGCAYRFNSVADLCALIWAIRTMLRRAGSIEAYFMSWHDSQAPDIGPALSRFCAAVLSLDYSPVFGPAGIPPDSSFPFLFPSPDRGSACKRLCMFLRWVVRPADGFDLGLWTGVRPDQLIIPVDAHVRRICGLLGLTSRRQADWRMAREITAALRRYDAHDPVKYDFSIAHLGISGGCTGREGDACVGCMLSGVCGRGRG